MSCEIEAMYPEESRVRSRLSEDKIKKLLEELSLDPDKAESWEILKNLSQW